MQWPFALNNLGMEISKVLDTFNFELNGKKTQTNKKCKANHEETLETELGEMFHSSPLNS